MSSPAHERFWSKVDRRGPDDCWPWLAATHGGYGQFWFDGRGRVAHKVAYLLTTGPVPEGMTLDHLCHDPATCDGGVTCPHRRCVNPAHLQPVPDRENVRRGSGVTAVNARKTHCVHGHEFTRANTYVNSKGSRECYVCRRAKEAERMRRVRAISAPPRR